MQIAIFILLSLGMLLKVFKGFRFEKKSRQKRSREHTAKEFVDELNGNQKVTYLEKNKQSVRDILEKTQSGHRYRGIMTKALVFAIGGFIAGLFLKNIFLAVILACGLYFIPLWITQFSLHSYKKTINEELEVALSLITTSYVRGNDILKAVTENLQNINYPVNEAFTAFVNSMNFVTTNINREIDVLKSKIDNKLFHEWCDLLILCQSDHTLKFTLIPIVNKFSNLKAQQLENENNMLLPLKNTVKMIMVVIAIVPLLYFFSNTWFYSLAGQIMLAITAAVIFWCIDAAIKISTPIEYDV